MNTKERVSLWTTALVGLVMSVVEFLSKVGII